MSRISRTGGYFDVSANDARHLIVSGRLYALHISVRPLILNAAAFNKLPTDMNYFHFKFIANQIYMEIFDYAFNSFR
jgi:hypothetical protein